MVILTHSVARSIAGLQGWEALAHLVYLLISFSLMYSATLGIIARIVVCNNRSFGIRRNPNGVVARLGQRRNSHASVALGCLHHLVFSTKERRSFLRNSATREALHAYLGGISKTLDCPPIMRWWDTWDARGLTYGQTFTKNASPL